MSELQTRTPIRVMLAGRLAIAGDLGSADESLLQGRQARLTFAVLVLERGRLLPRDELADVLWTDRLPGSWESALRNVVSRVREFLGAAGLDAAHVLRHEAGCYRLELPPGTVVDVEEAEQLVVEAGERLGRGDVDAGLAAAAEAHRVLGAPLLPGVDHPWLDRVRQRLGELGLRAAEHEAEARSRAGDHRAALATVEAVVDAAPFRETAHRLVMQIHDAAGNRAEALRAYERCRRMLAEELGVDPSPATEVMYLGLLGSEPPAAPAPAPAGEPLRPTGTVTFLFSDIERSAALWERHAEGMAAALQVHDDLMRGSVEAHGGRIFRHTGEGVAAVFAAARDALGAAVQAQRRFVVADWPSEAPVRVRLGLHTGEAELRGDDYTGATVHRAARLCAAGQGGQVLVSSATRLVVDGRLPDDVDLRHVGDLTVGGAAGREPVFQVVHRDLPAEFAVLGRDRLGGTTAVGGPLIGRSDDVARIDAALTEARLVTVVGPGGVGKTRLAHAVATEADIAGQQRVLWADLAGGDAAAVLDAVATSVGADRAGVAVLDATITALRGARSLLVLDNCEHVLHAAAEVAAALVHGCDELRIVATSQAPLGVAGEQLVALGPLPVPGEGDRFGEIVGSPAVEVFVRRARAANPAFELSVDNAGAIAEVCRRLDGLPLALELAAARVRSVAPAQIAAHLDERFRLLRTQRRDRGPRHGSLDAALRWSHELLDEQDRHLFDRLSVFAGVFDLDAAITVAAPDDADDLDVLESLDTLVERSMLLAVEAPAQTRYRLLESLREFGRRRLDERGATSELLGRHRRHHLELVEAAAVGVQGPDEAVWVQTLHRSLADVRAAFTAAAAEGDVDCCLRIVAALFDYGFFRMQRQVGLWAAEAVALPGAADHPAYEEAAAAAGFLAWARGDFDAADRWATTAAHDRAPWLAFDALGTIAMFQGRVQPAIDHWARAADVARAAGNRYQEAIAVGQMAFGHMLAGSDAATGLALTAKDLAASTRNPTASAHASWALGVALYDQDAEAALAELEASMVLSNLVDNRMAIGSARVPAEELRTKLADRSSTLDLRSAMDSLEYWESAGNPPNLWSTVRRVARTLADLGEHRWAAVALGAEMAASLKLPLRERERTRHEAVAHRVRDALGEAAFRSEVARASSLTPHELVSELRTAVESIVPPP